MSQTGRHAENNPTERIKLWGNTSKTLANQYLYQNTPKKIETVIPKTLPIPTHEFTKEEMIAAIKSTFVEKATGLDNIPLEVWKSGALLDQLEVSNKAFITGDSPLTWRKAAINPIPKKGDLSN